MFSDEYFIMHLTPLGWVEGTEKTTNGLVVRPLPDSIVFSLTFHETVSGILSMPEQRVDVKYHVDSKSDMLKISFATYGKLPERFLSWEIEVDW